MLRCDFRSNPRYRQPRLSSAAGMTLLELIIACSILLILSSMALPVFRLHGGTAKGVRAAIRFADNEGRDRPVQRPGRSTQVPNGSRERKLSAGFGYAGERCTTRGGRRQEAALPAQDSRGSHDRTSRLGIALRVRRPRLDKLVRQEHFRCLYEINRHGARWHKI